MADKKKNMFKGCGLEFDQCGSVEVMVWRENREDQENENEPMGYITINYPTQVNIKQQVEVHELELILEMAKQIEKFVASRNGELSKIIQQGQL